MQASTAKLRLTELALYAVCLCLELPERNGWFWGQDAFGSHQGAHEAMAGSYC